MIGQHWAVESWNHCRWRSVVRDGFASGRQALNAPSSYTHLNFHNLPQISLCDGRLDSARLVGPQFSGKLEPLSKGSALL